VKNWSPTFLSLVHTVLGVTLSILSLVCPDVLGRCSKQITLSPSEREEEEVHCFAQSKCLHWKAEPFSHQSRDPISKIHKCLGENKNLLGVTLSVPYLICPYVQNRQYPVSIRVEARPRDSCREFFKTLNILPQASQYMLSLALFMVTNKSSFRHNSEIHNFNTRNNSNFFQVTTHLMMFQKSPAYAGIKIYNHLPSDIKELVCDMRSFKKALQFFLHVHSFYTVDEFLLHKTR
jgi:hypothetical protein